MGIQSFFETTTGQVSAAFGASMLVPDVRMDHHGCETAPEVTVFVSVPVPVTVEEVAALIYELNLGDDVAELEPDEALQTAVELIAGAGYGEVEIVRERTAQGLVGAPAEVLANWRTCLELARSALAPVLPGPGPTPRPRKPSTAAPDASLMVGAGCNSGGQR
jgi:hypothetical protein